MSKGQATICAMAAYALFAFSWPTNVNANSTYQGKSATEWGTLLVDLSPEMRASAVRALSKMGELAIPVAVKALRNNAPDIQLSALEVLLALGPTAKAASSKVAPLTKSSEVGVRIHAAETLVAIDDKSLAVAKPVLLSSLGSGALGSDYNLRNTVIGAIGRLGPAAGNEGVAAIISALKTAYAEGRSMELNTDTVYKALIAIGSAGVAQLAIELKSLSIHDNGEWQVMGWIKNVLEGIGPDASPAAPALLPLLASHEEANTRDSAMRTLARIAPSNEAVIAALEEFSARPATKNPFEQILQRRARVAAACLRQGKTYDVARDPDPTCMAP